MPSDTRPPGSWDGFFPWEVDPQLLGRLTVFAERAEFFIQKEASILKDIPETIKACQEAIQQGLSQAGPEKLAILEKAGESLRLLFGEAEKFLKNINNAASNPQLLPEVQEQLKNKKALILGLHTAINRELDKIEKALWLYGQKQVGDRILESVEEPNEERKESLHRVLALKGDILKVETEILFPVYPVKEPFEQDIPLERFYDNPALIIKVVRKKKVIDKNGL